LIAKCEELKREKLFYEIAKENVKKILDSIMLLAYNVIR